MAGPGAEPSKGRVPKSQGEEQARRSPAKRAQVGQYPSLLARGAAARNVPVWPAKSRLMMPALLRARRSDGRGA